MTGSPNFWSEVAEYLLIDNGGRNRPIKILFHQQNLKFSQILTQNFEDTLLKSYLKIAAREETSFKCSLVKLNSGDYRRSYGGYSQRRYMRDREPMGQYAYDNYSYHGNMVDELRHLMETAPDERTRQEFGKFIQKMENM